MKKVCLFLLVAVLATSCNAQDKKTATKKTPEAVSETDSIRAPQERWQVKKEVDENGNVIRYDSLYSWSSNGQLKGMEADSIFKRMEALMTNRFSMFGGTGLPGFATHDSIMKSFFSDDIFKGIPGNISSMDEMMKQMEAMRQQFFNDRNRYIIPPEPKSRNNNTQTKQRI